MASSSSAAAGLLSRQLKAMQRDTDLPSISCGLIDDNVFEWEVMLMIDDECKFYGGACVARWGPTVSAAWSRWADGGFELGGFFRAVLKFPEQYPHLPPKMQFSPPIFHPNGAFSPSLCL